MDREKNNLDEDEYMKQKKKEYQEQYYIEKKEKRRKYMKEYYLRKYHQIQDGKFVKQKPAKPKVSPLTIERKEIVVSFK